MYEQKRRENNKKFEVYEEQLKAATPVLHGGPTYNSMQHPYTVEPLL